MENGFYNQHDFRTLAMALAVWTAQFTILWIASIVFPAQPLARWAALPFTLLAAGALAWLYLRAGRPALLTTPGLGLAIAAAGTLFNALPSLLG